MAKFCNMFSGSSGNCTYISSGAEGILIDVGVSCKQILQALNDNCITPESIKAIFITHSHTDHIKGLRVLLKKLKIPVFASNATLCNLLNEETFENEGNFFDIEGKNKPPINMQVDFFPTSHDCEGSGGYRITLPDGQKVAVCTDLGKVDDGIRKNLLGCKSVIIESNHDVGMLQNGPYPFATKQRILSDKGHLSNAVCACELPNLVKSGTTNIILSHLSRDNNTPDLAAVTANSVLTENGIKEGTDYCLYVSPKSGGKFFYI